MESGLVSVIICCFNGEKFLEQCFRCLLDQTCKHMELLFVDDGSTDKSYERAKEYVATFAQEGIKLICLTQEHKGAGGAAAHGLLRATGEFISCYDVDDILYPESIEKRKFFLEQYPYYSLVRTNGYKVSLDGLEKRLFVTEESEKKEEDIFEDLLFGKTNNWAGSYMVRAESLWRVYPDHHIPESQYGQNLQILMASAWRNKAGFIDEPLMEYQINPSSFTNCDTSFHAAYERLIGYKEIRLSVLERIGVEDRSVLLQLDKIYAYLLLDLCLRRQKKSEYLAHYNHLASLETTPPLYRYYYHLYKGDRILSFVFRIACSKTVGQFFRFGIIGILATAIHYGLFLGLKTLLPITFAYIIGYGISFLANYYLTSCFTFNKKISIQTSLGFLGAHLFNLALQTVLLHCFVYLGIKSSFAPIPVFAIAVPLNFLLVRFVFK